MAYTADYSSVEPSRAEIDALAGPVVVEFGAPWCGYCQGTQPTLQRLLANYPDVRHIKIYDGQGKPLGRSFQVRLWPTLIFLRDGKALQRAVRPAESEIAAGLTALATAE